MATGLAADGDLEAIVATIDWQLDAEVDFALNAPWPPPERALEEVYEVGGE